MTDNLKNAVPEFIYSEIDKLGEKIKILTFEDLRFLLNLKVTNKFNLKYPEDQFVDPIVVTILNKEKGGSKKDKLEWKPEETSAGSVRLVPTEQLLDNKKKIKVMEKKKIIMGVPPVRMYKGGHVVGRLLAKRTDLPSNMLGKLVKNGLEDNACNDYALSVYQMRNRFDKIVQGRYMKPKDLTPEMLRKLHNDVKYSLIKDVVKPGSSVLDVGGGHGGDLSKWKSVSAQLTMIDPDEDAVMEAKRRARKIYPRANIMQGDILSAGIRSEFDYVCYNFSLQYIFKKKWLASSSIFEIALSLKPGGKFFGVIPNGDKIKKYPLNWTDKMGNTMTRENQYSDTVSFYLVDTPYYQNGPIAEPLVSFKHLVKLCYEHSMKLVFSKDLLPERNGLISDIYTMFVFEKLPDKIINRNVVATKTIIDTNLEEMVNSIAKTKRIKNIKDLILYTEMALFDKIKKMRDTHIASEEVERLRPYIRIYANRALLSVSSTPSPSRSPVRRQARSPSRSPVRRQARSPSRSPIRRQSPKREPVVNRYVRFIKK